jgi:hypothetical protein
MSSLDAATCAAAQRNHSFAWGGYFAAITASISEFGTTPRDRLARILRFRCINRPARLPFVDRRVDDNEVIFSRNNKAVVAAPVANCTFGASSTSLKPVADAGKLTTSLSRKKALWDVSA